MTYWFTFMKSGRRKPFHQSCPCLKTMPAADVIETWSTDHGVYGDHGAESIHKIFNLLQRTHCSMKPARRRLEKMLKEHYRLVHPDKKASKPVIMKGKRHPEGEN